jgi:hypothetical protein
VLAVSVLNGRRISGLLTATFPVEDAEQIRLVAIALRLRALLTSPG